LQRSEAQFTRSELEYKRQRTLHQQKAISDADFEQAQANYTSAQKDLEAAKQTVVASEFIIKSSQASVNEASENLRLTNVNSPVSGIVSSLKVEQGERVVGTQQMAGTEMMTIADLSKMEVRVDVNENDIVRLSYKELVVAGNKYPFRPGMTASVEILTNSKNNALAIPLSAVTTREDKKDSLAGAPVKAKEIVFVSENGVAKIREVKTGISDYENIEILSGLKEGDEVISGPYFVVSKQLKEGDKVKKMSAVKPEEEKEEE
jgi:HlyD family secretion protein